MKSPSSLCSGSPGASSLSSEDAERIQKLERRILGVAQFQVERDLLEEFRYRDYEQKLQAEERTWQAQLCDVQKLRAEAAQRKKAQHEEVEDRRQHLQGNLANVRESKVTAQDAFCQRRCRELREAQQRRIEERRMEQLERSKEMAERLKSIEDQRQLVHEQKQQAEKEKQAKWLEKEQQKAETRLQVLQVWQRSEELRKYAKEMLAAGHHDELFQQLQEMRLELNSPSQFSFPAGSPPSTPATSCSGRTGFAPPSRAKPPAKPKQKSPGPELDMEPPLAEEEVFATGTYDSLMHVFEAKVAGKAEAGARAQRF